MVWENFAIVAIHIWLLGRWFKLIDIAKDNGNWKDDYGKF